MATVGLWWYERSKMARLLVRLASAGTPPQAAQAPKAMTSCDLRRSSFATRSCSAVRTAPLMNDTAMAPSSRASTSEYLKSSATGQSTISTAAVTSRMSSARSTTASSQPPQEAHQ